MSLGGKLRGKKTLQLINRVGDPSPCKPVIIPLPWKLLGKVKMDLCYRRWVEVVDARENFFILKCARVLTK